MALYQILAAGEGKLPDEIDPDVLFVWSISQIRDECNCTFSAAIREIEILPPNLLQSLLVYRSFARVYNAYVAAQAAKDSDKEAKILATKMGQQLFRIQAAIAMNRPLEEIP